MVASIIILIITLILNEIMLGEMIRHYAPSHGLALTAAEVALITDLAFPPP